MSRNVSNERLSTIFTLLTVLVKASHFCPKHVYDACRSLLGFSSGNHGSRVRCIISGFLIILNEPFFEASTYLA